MNQYQNNEIQNNNSEDISGNMYSYQEDSQQSPPHELNANAIRRSMEMENGINPNINPNINPSINPNINQNINPSINQNINQNTNDINNINNQITNNNNDIPINKINAQTRYMDQFPETAPIRQVNTKNQNLPGYPNVVENRSSEQRLPRLQENQSQFNVYPPVQNEYLPYNYHIPRRGSNQFYFLIYLIIAIYHIVMIVLIGWLYEFDDDNISDDFYHFFKDVHLMIFIGFGMLYTILKDHQWSSMALVFFIGIISIEFSFFCSLLWTNSFDNNWQKGTINYETLLNIDFNSATVIISLGSVIGKLSMIQYFIMAIFEIFFSSLSYYLCLYILKAVYYGWNIYIHIYGAVFGLLLSIVLFCRETEYSKISNSPHKGSDYYSTIFSFIGCLFLWIFFPIFNTANIAYIDDVSPNILRYRGIINTYLSIVGSIISTFITSPLIYNAKFKMEHILNATYVGGIIIGGCCTVNTFVWTSLVIGCGGGIITTLLLWKLKSILKNSQLDDTLGILHIFGIPGILGGFLTSFYLIPYEPIGDDKRGLEIGLQIATICITLAISGLSGVVTGFVINSMNCQKNEKYFVDSDLFVEDENFYFPEMRYPRQNDTNLSSSGNKLDEQEREEREVNIDQGI